MNKKTLLLSVFGVVLAGLAVIQFIPAPAIVVPDQLPVAQRSDHRLLNFEGISNFRDLGGYATEQGKTVKWGVLYRSGTLAHATPSDLNALSSLSLQSLIDFRSSAEKEEEPNRLPEPVGFEVVEIPTLDGGDNSVADEVMRRIDTGDFADFDPDAFMLAANRQFAVTFAPQYREFLQTVIAANGAPVAWHCSA
ncbi:MAG: tyrosine-protein phosphatase, partial [Halieaceae bacterium]